MSDDPRAPVSGEVFHAGDGQVYDAPLGWAVNKRHERMAKVVYEAVHENLAFPAGDPRRGAGKDHATWVFAEEPGIAEGHFETGFELAIDARLEPNATIGLHVHGHTEEFYYLLEGALRMTTVAPDGQEASFDMRPGDAHLVKLGQGHYGVAGPDGARFLAVAVRKR